MMRQPPYPHHDGRTMAGLFVGAVLFACVLGLLLDRLLEMAL